MHATSGAQAELIAERHVSSHGLDVIDKNFQCRFGEIDLVAIDGKTLVFIEVRYRRHQQVMAVTETIDRRKLSHLITTGEAYLHRHRHHKNRQYRFDVIAISGEQQSPVIEWIKNAFQA